MSARKTIGGALWFALGLLALTWTLFLLGGILKNDWEPLKGTWVALAIMTVVVLVAMAFTRSQKA